MVEFANNITTALGATDSLAPTASATRAVTRRLRPGKAPQSHGTKSKNADVANDAGVIQSASLPAAEVVAPAKTGLGKWMPSGGAVFNTAVNTAGFAEMALLLPVGVGHAMNWVGKSTGLKPLQKAGTKITGVKDASGERVGGLIEWANKPKLADFGISEKNAIAQKMADGASGVVKHSGMDRLSGWNANRHKKRASVRWQEARDLSSNTIRVGHSGIDNELDTINNALKNTSGPSEEVAKKVTAATERLEKIVETDTKAAKAYSNVKSRVGRITNSVGKSLDHHDIATSGRTLSAGTKDIVKTVSNASVLTTISHAAWSVQQLKSMHEDGQSFSIGWKNLKQAYADVTGQDVKNVSNTQLFFAKLPTALKDERSRLVKLLSAKELADFVGLGVILWQFVRSGKIQHARTSLLGANAIDMMAVMLPDQFAKAADSMIGGTFGPIYGALREAHNHGEKIPTEAYAALLASASPELRKRGEKSAFTLKIAEHYANQNTSPVDVMKDIVSGKIDKEYVPMLVKANKEAKLKQAHDKQEAASHSHVDTLNKSREQSGDNKTIQHAAGRKTPEHSHVNVVGKNKAPKPEGEKYTAIATQEPNSTVERS